MVRFALESELDRVNALRKQVDDLHAEHRPDVFRAGFGSDLREYARILLQSETGDILVVERDGVLCGMACVDYVRRPESPYSRARSFYHVQELAVDAAYRRRGVAAELFDFIKADAAQKGFDRVELDVWAFNESAVAFYEAMGFQSTRIWMEYTL